MATKTEVPHKGIQEQRDLIGRLESDDFGWDLMVGDAFVRGMRDIGYKSTAFALAELVDNSIQAACHQDRRRLRIRGRREAEQARGD